MKHKKSRNAGQQGGISKTKQSNYSKDKQHEAFKKKMFPHKKYKCFECDTRLTDLNRKRIVTCRKFPNHVAMVGYQLCIPCAELLQADKFHALPVIARDIAEADFNSGLTGCVGGVQ